MIKAGNTTKGTYLVWQGNPCLVTNRKLTHLGRGSAKARVELKNLKTGATVTQVFNSDDLLEDIEVLRQDVQYLYQEGKSFLFMNLQTYEQYELDDSLIGNEKVFLVEGERYQLMLHENEAIGLILPKKITLEVVKTDRSIKGDTVSGATKPAELETGLIVKVPLFVNKGEKLIVNTETSEYVSRA